jgi:hypothetical protein
VSNTGGEHEQPSQAPRHISNHRRPSPDITEAAAALTVLLPTRTRPQAAREPIAGSSAGDTSRARSRYRWRGKAGNPAHRRAAAAPASGSEIGVGVMLTTDDRTAARAAPLPPVPAGGSPATVNASPTGLARLARYLRTAHHRRLLYHLRRNAEWSTQARGTPTIQSWLDSQNSRQYEAGRADVNRGGPASHELRRFR